MKKDEFKEFVRNNPKLIDYVRNNEMTWQKFYEIYDLYGEDSEIWNKYLNNTTSTTNFSLNEFTNWLKNIDLNGLQEGINNVQRVLGVVQDLTKKNDIPKEEYKPRPLYKHFED